MIERNINETLLTRDPSAKSLINMIVNIDNKKDLGPCSIYYHFPLYPALIGDKPITANLLLCTQNYGVTIFQCIEYSNRLELEKETVIDEIDQIDRLIYAKLLKDAPNLRKGRRDLKVNIKSVIFLHNFNSKPNDYPEFADFSIITTEHELDSIIKMDKNILDDIDYKDLKATIEGSKGIPKPIERTLRQKENLKSSKGAILTAIENQICNFDLEQKRAALFTLDGAQRIRGLAGSGKTIILAMKAAIIHLQNENAEILYTYYTKALHDIVKRLITRFYRQFADKDPNWNKIHIMHAWGGKGLDGVYYNACNFNSLGTINFTEAKIKRPSDAFDYVCEKLNDYKLRQQYDYTLLDEAQDFSVHFYRICRQITKGNKVVWAYDDFQNILHVKMQSEKETFGKDTKGEWYIDFDRKSDELQDLVLHKCYRNPRKILITAFALGLGIYNESRDTKNIQIIQRLESNEHWESLGFEVEAGKSSEGDEMIISRSSQNTPLLKNEYLDNEADIIKILSFETVDEECTEVSKLIFSDLKDELNPEDITVVCLDDRNAKKYFSVLSSKLYALKIKTFNLMTAPNDNTIFKVPNHVTLSTIYKAKGNEAGSVYILGSDSVFFQNNRNDITQRNKIFTAITRAQGWVTLSGIGSLGLDQCIREFDILKCHDFKLKFIQPSEVEVMTIRHDISKKQSALNKIERMADELFTDIGMDKEDVVEEIKNKLLNKK